MVVDVAEKRKVPGVNSVITTVFMKFPSYSLREMLLDLCFLI